MSGMGWLQDVVNGLAIAEKQRRAQVVMTALTDGIILGFDIIAQVRAEHPGAEIEEVIALSAGHPRAAYMDPWIRRLVISVHAMKCGMIASRIMAEVGAKFEDATADQAFHLAMADPRSQQIEEIVRAHLIGHMAWRRDVMLARAAQANELEQRVRSLARLLDLPPEPMILEVRRTNLITEDEARACLQRLREDPSSVQELRAPLQEELAALEHELGKLRTPERGRQSEAEEAARRKEAGDVDALLDQRFEEQAAIFDEIRYMNRAQYEASRYRNDECTPVFQDDPEADFDFPTANKEYGRWLAHHYVRFMSEALALFELLTRDRQSGKEERFLIPAIDPAEARRLALASRYTWNEKYKQILEIKKLVPKRAA